MSMNLTMIWFSNYPSLVRYLQRMTRSRADAEDLAQTTFVKAMEHYDELEAYSPEHIKAWLMRTAYNAFIDDMRRKKKQVPMAEDSFQTYEEDFSGVHVDQWLERLPDNLCTVVTMRHIEGYTSTQIGEALDLPPATVRTRLRTAMILLKQYEEEIKK